MSDDTPTQRFEPEGSDAPTQRFDAAGGTPSEEVVEERKSRKLMIILGSIGGALLLAVIILLIFLLVKPFGPGGDPKDSPSPTQSGSASPSPTPTKSNSSTPTPTPTPTPTTPPPPPPPPNTDATVNSFTVSDDVVTCNSQAPGGPFPIYIDFSWSSSNVDAVYFGVNTNDASQGWLFDNLPPSGTSANFPPGYYPYEFPCGNASLKYTITVVGSNGSKDSASVTVTNNGD